MEESRAALWVAFNLAVVVILAIDLGLAKGGKAPTSARASLTWTAVWVSLSLGFCGAIYLLGVKGIWPWGGRDAAMQFLTAYVVEYALSVDNLFVFLVVFSYFKIAPQTQHKLLFWGVLSAFIMRATLILLGSALVSRFHWLLFIFGAFLIYTAIKLVVQKEDETVDPAQSPMLRYARKIFPISEKEDGSNFTTREDGKFRFTPLFLVLIVVETTDLLFAVDSIPAVLGISQDPFIIYSSNVCAVLGLRSLFFVVSTLMGKFHYLKYGLSAVLAFVGSKMLVEPWFKVPVPISLAVIAGILTASVVVSMLRPLPPEDAAPPSAP